MPDISKLKVEDTTYDIKDSVARRGVQDLSQSLGALAYKNSVNPTSVSLTHIDSVGSLPSWVASVSEETLSFSFNAGALPTTQNQTVVTGVTVS